MFVETDEKQALTELIDTFYQAAGEAGWKGPINDNVARIFVEILLEAQRGLKDYSWSLILPEQGATVNWLIYQIDNYAIERMGQLNRETSCLEFAIEKWGEHLRMAAKYDVILEEDEDDG